MMKHSFAFLGTAPRVAILLAASSALTSCAAAQGSKTDSAQNSDAIDASAMAALDKMGGYLQKLTTFGVHAVVTSEDVMQDGRKAQESSTMDVIAQRPSRFR